MVAAVIVGALLLGGGAGGFAGWWAGSSTASSVAGAPGADGRDGVDGRDGTDGTDGTDGAAGRDGADGRSGAPDAVGASGPIGPRGPQGPVGPAGPPGADGSAVEFSAVRFAVTGEGVSFEPSPGQTLIVPLQLSGEYRFGDEAPTIIATTAPVGGALRGEGDGLYRWQIVMRLVETESQALRELRFVVAGAGVDPQLIELEPVTEIRPAGDGVAVEIEATVYVELAEGAELVALYTSQAGITDVRGGVVSFERVG